MVVKGFRLLADGIGGIEAFIEEVNEKGRVSVTDKIKKERSVPVPVTLKMSMNKLRYYYLHLTGYWNSGWDNLMNSERSALADDLTDEQVKSPEFEKISFLLDNLIITGAYIRGDGFKINGKLKTLGNKVVTPCTPFTSIDDEYEFFDEAIKLLMEVNRQIKEYMENEQFVKQDPRSYLLGLARSEEERIRIQAADDRDLEEEQLKKLEEQGKIIILDGLDEAINPDKEESKEKPKEVVIKPKEEKPKENMEPVGKKVEMKPAEAKKKSTKETEKTGTDDW